MKTKDTKDNIVGVKELRQNLDKYITEVKKGKTFTVFRRSKPVFKLTSPVSEEEMWETVIDFTKIKKGGVPLTEVRQALARLD